MISAADPFEGRSFDEIERALRDSAYGRWFLEEYARRRCRADTDEAIAAVNRLHDWLASRPQSVRAEAIHRQLVDMAKAVGRSRSEIEAVNAQFQPAGRVLSATDELNAITSTTQKATEEILGATERLSLVADKLKDEGADGMLCDEIAEQTMRILMACSFQDINGQRTTRIASILGTLESRMGALMSLWNIEAARSVPATPEDAKNDAHLLHGPQNRGRGCTQQDIDRLFGEAC